MKTIIGALALTFAVPAVAQQASTADQHTGHGKHQHAPADHSHHGRGTAQAETMTDCRKTMANAKCKAHCKAMMSQHGTAASSARKAGGHEGHAH